MEKGVRRATADSCFGLVGPRQRCVCLVALDSHTLGRPEHILTQSAGEHHRDHPPNHSHSIVPLVPHLCPVECQRVHLYSLIVRLPRKEYSEIPTRQFAVESLY